MAAKPINIGDMQFARKGDAEEYLKSMLYKYELGDRVSADDAKILTILLERHSEAEEKIGGGVSHFSVRSADFGTRCFWLNRTDGTTEKFSARSCL